VRAVLLTERRKADVEGRTKDGNKGIKDIISAFKKHKKLSETFLQLNIVYRQKGQSKSWAGFE